LAKFNPSLPKSGEPSYLSHSKETSGDKSLATLVAGLGGLAITGMGVYDEEEKKAVTKEAEAVATKTRDDETRLLQEDNARLRGETSSLTGTPVPSVDAGTAPATPPAAEPTIDPKIPATANPADAPGPDYDERSLFSEDLLSGQNLPEPIKKEIGDMSRYGKGVAAGKMRYTDYTGRMDAKAKELINRYPRHAEEIRKAFQSVTGQDPANANAAAVRHENTQLLAERSAQANKHETWIRSLADSGLLPKDYHEKARQGTPYPDAYLEHYANDKVAKEREVRSEKAQLELDKERGQLNQQKTNRAITKGLGYVVSGKMNDVFNQDVMAKIVEYGKKGVNATPQEKAQLTQGIAFMELDLRKAIAEEWMKPTRNGETYASLLDDPKKQQEMTEAALEPFRIYKQFLDDGNYGLLTAAKRANEAIGQSEQFMLLQQPAMRTLEGIGRVGPAAVETLRVATTNNESWTKTLNKDLQLYLQNKFAETVNGMPNKDTALVGASEWILKFPEATDNEKRSALNALPNGNLNILMAPNVPAQSQDAAVENLYGFDNQKYIEKLKTSEDKIGMFNKLFRTPVTKKMLEIRQRNPQAWDQYVEALKTSFIAVQQSNIATVQEGYSERGDISVTQNKESGEFEFKITTGPQAGKRINETISGGPEAAMSNEVKNSVRSVNNAIRMVKEVVKEGGGDPEKAVKELLDAAGLDPKRPRTKTLWNKIRGAIANELDPKSTTPPKQQPIPEEVLPTNPLIKPGVKQESDRLPLTTDSSDHKKQ
jgi:hypothetical protein